MDGPSFFIIGAPRCGTTAMHRLLSLHPSLLMSSPKEPNFYLFDGQRPSFGGPLGDLLAAQVVSSRRDYLALFDTEGAQGVAHRGETSPFYLYSDVARRGIARDVPNARILILLRDPVERTYSHYLMLRRDQREPASTFSEALDMELERLQQGWALSYGYERLSRYARFVPDWLETFPNVLLLTNEEFRADPQKAVGLVCEFLGVKPVELLDHASKENVAGIPRSRALHRFLSSDSRIKRAGRLLLSQDRARDVASSVRRWNLEYPTLEPQDAERLRTVLAPDAKAMTPLLGQKINQWSTTFPPAS